MKLIKSAQTSMIFNILATGVDKYEGLNANSLNVKTLNETSINAEPLTLNADRLTPNVGDILVRVDPRYFRPTEVDLLLGDPTKAKTQLGWKLEYDLQGLVEDMMRGDLGVHG